MLLHEKEKVSIDERINRAFKYSNRAEEKQECYKIFEKYMLGGIEFLKEKLLDNAISIDDYINNIYYFLADYNDRYNNIISENDILDLCMNKDSIYE